MYQPLLCSYLGRERLRNAKLERAEGIDIWQANAKLHQRLRHLGPNTDNTYARP